MVLVSRARVFTWWLDNVNYWYGLCGTLRLRLNRSLREKLRPTQMQCVKVGESGSQQLNVAACGSGRLPQYGRKAADTKGAALP